MASFLTFFPLFFFFSSRTHAHSQHKHTYTGAYNLEESAEFSDLKGLIKTTLGKQGVLSVFKSQMRRCVLHALRIADEVDCAGGAEKSRESLSEWNHLETLMKLIEKAMRPPFGVAGTPFLQSAEGRQSVQLISAFLV